ncbi:MAG TPA: hypothetical protein VIL33_03140 [Rhodothermia bacterium]
MPRNRASVPQDPSALGYLNLHKRHPDGSEGRVEFDSSYSSGQALQRLEQIRSFLTSFSRLTEQVRGRLNQARLQAIGNTGAEMQTIGFHNIPLVVEGTLLKQEYQVTQARYEVAQLKYDRQQIGADELARWRSAYQDATKRFQTFWDTKLPTD